MNFKDALVSFLVDGLPAPPMGTAHMYELVEAGPFAGYTQSLRTGIYFHPRAIAVLWGSK